MNAPLSETELQQFQEDGFVVKRQCVSFDSLTPLQKTIEGLCRMQASKLKKFNDVAGKNPGKFDADRLKDFDDLIVGILKRDPEIFVEADKMLPSAPLARSFIVSSPIPDIAEQILNCDKTLQIIQGPSFIANVPEAKDRLYTWHAETCWYPKRRRFVNFWAPAFRDKTPDNGTMRALKKSHQRAWDFSEFYGYDEQSEGDKSYYLQYEIPESELEGFEDVAIEAAPGDLVIFDRNLVHSSSVNQSLSPSYALACRAYDFRTDLTVSANWGERPYGDKPSGRAGIRPLDLDK